MIEEIKQDNNCIVKAFENNMISILHENTENKRIYYFKASDIGKALDLSNIRVSIQNYEEETEVVIKKAFDLRGVEQDAIFLTSQGVYRLLYNTKKPIAKKFRKWAGDILDDIIFNESKELKDQIEKYQKELEQRENALTRVRHQSMMHKHNLLLKQYGNYKNIVYIILVKVIEGRTNEIVNNQNDCHMGKYIIKIGESRKGLKGRYDDHKDKYPECIILDCYPVAKSQDFEKFLHRKLSAYRYRKLEGHEKEHELFHVGNGLTYAYVKNLIEENINDYNDHEVVIERQKAKICQMKLELEKVQAMLDEQNNGKFNETLLLEKFEKMVENKIDDLKGVLLEEIRKVNVKSQLKLTNNFGERYHALGKKIQQINPDNMQLVKVFESIADVSKTFKFPKSSVTKAIQENTIYKNFRWAYDDEEVQPTRSLKKNQNSGYVAKLNSAKDKILAVYLNGQVASKENGYESVAYLDAYIKSGKQVDGVYYVRYHDGCSEEIKKEFLQATGNKEIVLYKNEGVGVYNLENELIREFRSKHDCTSNTKIGSKSIRKALNSGESYDEFYYKYLYNKTVISRQQNDT